MFLQRSRLHTTTHQLQLKSHSSLRLIAFALALIVISLQSAPARAQQDVPQGVWVREGCRLSVAVSTIKGPRFLCFAPDGTLFVSVPEGGSTTAEPNLGSIRACRDKDGDGVYETVTTWVKGYPSVHGMFWHDGWLWFTESGAVHRGRDTNGDGVADEVVDILTGLPKGGHWWRSILIHNGRLYTSIGDSGNITDQTDTDRQKIWSYTLDGKERKLFVSGIRNTEKLVVRPGTDEIWGMDHGSDWFGRELERRDKGSGQPITDMYPPDEMNRYVEGGFYGHPFIVGARLPRYEYMERKDIVALAAKTIVPEWSTGAHWAPNAMMFYTAGQFPDAKGDAFVTYHGSWNRSIKNGYCVTRVRFEDGHPWGEQVYAKFLAADEGQKVLGRPVDVVQAPDGSLLISDDYGDKVYRLSYAGK